MHILVDDRESSVFEYITQINEQHEDPVFVVERMTVGDYALIHDNRVLICIERKTWKDLAASIKDGRKRNVAKMIQAREETGCRLMYVIEGRAFPNPKGKVAGIRYKALQAHLDHLMIRDGIQVIQTSGRAHTVHRLAQLMQNACTLGDEYLGGAALNSAPNGAALNSAAVLQKKHIKDDTAVIYDLWCAIPFITSKTASLFIEDGVTVRDFLLGGVAEADIAVMKYPSKVTVGRKRAKKMLKSRELATTHRAVLRAIPGVGPTTADAILKSHTLPELLSMDVSEVKEATSDLRVVNRKVMTNMIKFLW
jgi:ERCC4-type nuclease